MTREAHEFGHTGVNLVNSHSYGGTTTLYTSNGDRQLTQIDVGGELISLFYEPGGRLDSIVGGGTAMTYTYGPSGLLLRAAAPGGTVEYSRDGFLLTRESLTGEIAATVDYTYNADLRLGAESLRGISVAYGYDADGFITTAGTMSLTRRTDNGAVASTTLASTRTEYIYSATGDLQSLAASHSGTALLSFNYTRDAADRITSTGDTDYDFDDAGRLIRVLRGGTAIAEYDYDENGNRTAHRWLGGSASATYDDQDRLVEYGGTSYRYDQNGTLEAKITGGETSTFDYDALGNLRNASLPGGTRIDYLIDGQNRRVGKKIDGILMQGWIYAGQLRVIAEVDGTGAVISRFIYGTRSIVPDYMVKDGMTYRIVSDHLGSPRLVINASTGAIAQRLDYDAYGVVISDSAPGFQPFGFAGGLYDRDTRLVRFGARDYDPSVGRWTSKEPFLFAGGETNPYAYGFGDPVNYADYSGLAPVNPEVAFAVGGALVGVAGQAFGDIIAGEVSPWEDYVGSAVGGAVTALVLKNAGPVPAGLIGGAAGSFVRQSLKVMTGKQCAFNWVDFGTEVTIGGIGGKIFGTAAKAGITLGRNSMAKIYKEYMTKIANGTVNYISPKTAAKMFVGRATDAGFFSGTAGGAAMSLGVSNVWDSPDPNCGCR